MNQQLSLKGISSLTKVCLYLALPQPHFESETIWLRCDAASTALTVTHLFISNLNLVNSGLSIFLTDLAEFEYFMTSCVLRIRIAKVKS